MLKTAARLTARTLAAALLLAAAYAGWKWGDAVFPRLEGLLGFGASDDPAPAMADPPVRVTPAAAERVTSRIRAFLESDDRELRIKGFELASLLRYSAAGRVPAGVIEPAVAMKGGVIELRARVVPAMVPERPDLAGVIGILRDTVPVAVNGSLVPLPAGGSMLLVTGMEADGIALPRAAFPEILSALGRKSAEGLPASAILLPSLPGIRSVSVEGGELVLAR